MRPLQDVAAKSSDEETSMPASNGMTYDEIMEARFAASERFKKAVGQRIWFPEKVRESDANEWVRRVAAIANKKPLPCTITPEDVELEDAS